MNRQISHEASQVLRDNLLVKLTSDCIGSWGAKLHNPNEEKECCITCCASQLTLTLNTDRNNFVSVFPADEISTICRLLMYSCAGASLSIMITGIALNITSIMKLLEPFRCLRGLASVRISGQVSDEYKSLLVAKMTERRPDINAAAEEIQDTIEQSDQAASMGDYPTAIAKYKRAFEVCVDYMSMDFRFKPVIEKGRFRGRLLHDAFSQTQCELEWKLGVTYLKMKKYQRAHEWILEILYDIPDAVMHFSGGISPFTCPRGAQIANLYLLLAQASEGLGDMRQAIKEMKEAVRHDDKDWTLAIELVRLESKMKQGT